MEASRSLAQELDDSGLRLDDGLVGQLDAYFALLRRWNRTINLTGLDFDEGRKAVSRLLVEPLLAAHLLPHGSALLDIGSGGGSPGIPLALATRASELTLVESKSRKAAFLADAVRLVPVPSARVTCARWEAVVALAAEQQRYDAVSMRAIRVETGDFDRFRPVLRPGGRVLMFHSGASVPVLPVGWGAERPLPLVSELDSFVSVMSPLA
ncbi:MAG: 16S rRNA (guanine(527)-N(7))-methyltransferase RsmG [Acidobacteria bacterium]|nr:16S rRNA (guanine(527)-N(7))-methyltransferase RsmG [Acidobacteriota bacterium]